MTSLVFFLSCYFCLLQKTLLQLRLNHRPGVPWRRDAFRLNSSPPHRLLHEFDEVHRSIFFLRPYLENSVCPTLRCTPPHAHGPLCFLPLAFMSISGHNAPAPGSPSPVSAFSGLWFHRLPPPLLPFFGVFVVFMVLFPTYFFFFGLPSSSFFEVWYVSRNFCNRVLFFLNGSFPIFDSGCRLSCKNHLSVVVALH